MKPRPIAEIVSRIRPLANIHKAAHLRAHISSEQGGNIHRTSVRIRELQAALMTVVNSDLGRPRKHRQVG